MDIQKIRSAPTLERTEAETKNLSNIAGFSVGTTMGLMIMFVGMVFTDPNVYRLALTLIIVLATSKATISINKNLLKMFPLPRRLVLATWKNKNWKRGFIFSFFWTASITILDFFF